MELDEDAEDQRDVELSSLEAIFPEIQKPDPAAPYTFALEVPVKPAQAVSVSFPAPATDTAPVPVPVPVPVPGPPATLANSGPGDEADNSNPNPDPNHNHNNNNNFESHNLSYLPSLQLRISLPAGYPAETAPAVDISTTPPWLPARQVRLLQDELVRLWEELGRDLVVFSYIDHVQQLADDGIFGMVDAAGSLVVDAMHKIAILDYDIKAKQAAFEKETFDCGVCLEPKKGSVCHRMMDCGHIFCVKCLQDFYDSAIKEGDLAAVRCLAPNCAKERETAQSSNGKKRRKIKTFVSPSELLQIPLDQDTVKRYVTLKYKTELETDKNTIYCPRPWCKGAARSKKHKKPEGLELHDTTDDEVDEEDIGGEGETSYKKDLLAICEDCGLAFCSRCYQSWHGEFARCMPRSTDDLSKEELASLEYLKLHSTPCPTCAAPAQKTHGCNHMVCFRCQSHFCYLCSSWLDPGNPYQHFNKLPNGKVTSCFMRLWELEGGDGDDVDNGFAGGHVPAAAPPQHQPAAQGQAPGIPVLNIVPVVEEPEDEDEDEDERDIGGRRRNEGRRRGQRGGARVDVAREGPLVLRIGGEPAPRRPVVAGVPPAVPQPPGAAMARGGGGGGGGGGVAAAAAAGGGRNAANQARFPQRGRGRGRGGQHLGGRGGGPHNRQNQQAGGHQEHAGPAGQRGNAEVVDLDERQQAWVRHFVQLALNDEEHLVEWDSDDEPDEANVIVVD